MADNDKTWKTTEADATQTLEFALAALDEAYSVAVSTADAVWYVASTLAQIHLWDDVRQAENTHNTTLGDLWSDFRSGEYTAQAGAMRTLSKKRAREQEKARKGSGLFD
jgi:hypothetical protein